MCTCGTPPLGTHFQMHMTQQNRRSRDDPFHFSRLSPPFLSSPYLSSSVMPTCRRPRCMSLHHRSPCGDLRCDRLWSPAAGAAFAPQWMVSSLPPAAASTFCCVSPLAGTAAPPYARPWPASAHCTTTRGVSRHLVRGGGAGASYCCCAAHAMFPDRSQDLKFDSD